MFKIVTRNFSCIFIAFLIIKLFCALSVLEKCSIITLVVRAESLLSATQRRLTPEDPAKIETDSDF